MFEPGQEEQAANEIKNFWENLEDSKIYNTWDWWYIEGLLYKNGLFDNSPFVKTMADLAKKYPGGFKRRVVVGLTDINAGNQQI
jgi:hypothetical protein